VPRRSIRAWPLVLAAAADKARVADSSPSGCDCGLSCTPKQKTPSMIRRAMIMCEVGTQCGRARGPQASRCAVSP
jgi:hypothetical protein